VARVYKSILEYFDYERNEMIGSATRREIVMRLRPESAVLTFVEAQVRFVQKEIERHLARQVL